MTVFMSNHALAHLKSITCCSTGRIHACKTVTSNLMYTDAEMSHTSKVKPMKTFRLDAVHVHMPVALSQSFKHNRRTTMNPLHEAHQRLLRQQPLFSQLKPDQMALIIQASQVRHLSKGQFLFKKGDVPTHFYVVFSGRVKLNLLSEFGDEKVVTIIEQATTFAEAIILGSVPFCPLNAEAMEASEVICIHAATYRDILSQSPQACFQTIAQLSKRLHWMIGEIDRLTLRNATYRLVHYVLEHSHSSEKTVDTPKAVMASRISVKPETLSRILKQLQDQSLLETDGREIRILNEPELKAFLSTLD